MNSCRCFSSNRNGLLSGVLLESPYLIEFIHPIFIETIRLFANSRLRILYGEIPVQQNPKNDLKADSIVIGTEDFIGDVHLGYFESSRLDETTITKEHSDFFKLVTEGRDAIIRFGKIMHDENLSGESPPVYLIHLFRNKIAFYRMWWDTETSVFIINQFDVATVPQEFGGIEFCKGLLSGFLRVVLEMSTWASIVRNTYLQGIRFSPRQSKLTVAQRPISSSR